MSPKEQCQILIQNLIYQRMDLSFDNILKDSKLNKIFANDKLSDKEKVEYYLQKAHLDNPDIFAFTNFDMLKTVIINNIDCSQVKSGYDIYILSVISLSKEYTDKYFPFLSDITNSESSLFSEQNMLQLFKKGLEFYNNTMIYESKHFTNSVLGKRKRDD